jgi:RHS repeat-associated protein
MIVAGQPPVLYSYDVNSRVTQIAQGSSVVSFNYDNADRRSSITLPNGVVANYQYDNSSRLIGITYQRGGSSLGGVVYAYDPLGRRIQVSGSLIQSGMPQAVASATYDSANELINWNGASLTYDANGNLLSDGSNSFQWNARNQLASLNGSNSIYDALGRRVQNFQGTSFLYDGQDSVLELAGATTVANRLIGSTDEFFSRSDSSGSFTPLVDGLGSVLALVDSNGTLQTSYVYDPFGNTTAQGSTSSNPFQFTGRENDLTGLYYYRARYYSPVFNRFVSEDPAGFHGGDFNLYPYVRSSPANFKDPQGKFVIPLIIAGIGGTIGAINDGIKAYGCGKRGWDLAADVGRGFAGGAVGSLVGLAVGGLTENPFLGGVAGSEAADLTKAALGGGLNPDEFVQNALVGGVLGPVSEALGPEVRGGSNFNPWFSPRTFGPKATQAYAREAIADVDNAAFDQGRNAGKQMAGRKNGSGDGKKPGCE